MSSRVRVYWLPAHAYLWRFVWRREEYWYRLHFWPIAVLIWRNP